MPQIPADHRYFTEFTWEKGAIYSFAGLYVLGVFIIVLIQPFLTLTCDLPKGEPLDYSNPQYDFDPCNYVHQPKLLGLTIENCVRARHLILSIFLGGVVGWERRAADRPAGIRTMSLVSLGSCLFTLCSTWAFISGPMNWDAARVSAAIPSGVGFLGSALIFKHQEGEGHQVHGLTTAASVWLSAAIGISCGGGLYAVACVTTAIILVVLRFAPRSFDPALIETEEEEDTAEVVVQESSDLTRLLIPPSTPLARTLSRKDLARLRPNLTT